MVVCVCLFVSVPTCCASLVCVTYTDASIYMVVCVCLFVSVPTCCQMYIAPV